MHTRLVYILLLSLLPGVTLAQKKAVKPAPENQKPMKTFKTPEWVPAGYKADHPIYFPDYETFYHPQRGFITREKDSWVASPDMPLFLKNSDLKKTRIQILDDIGLDPHPELNYPRYMKMYPADPSKKAILVPVPKSAGQSGAQ